MADRADRLSARRKDRSQDTQEQQAQEEKPEEPGQQEHPEQPDRPEQEGQRSVTQSAKDQYQGTYIYLPEDLRTEFDLVGSELDTQRQRRNGTEVEKIRHFEPLVVALGLEQIDEMDDGQLEERLAKYDP